MTTKEKMRRTDIEKEGKLIAINFLNTNYLDHEEICALISYVQKAYRQIDTAT